MVGKAGSSKPITPGTPRRRVWAVIGSPDETDDAGSVDAFHFSSHWCRVISLLPTSHAWLAGFEHFHTYRILFIHYDDAGLVRSTKFLTDDQYERERDRLARTGTRLRRPTTQSGESDAAG